MSRHAQGVLVMRPRLAVISAIPSPERLRTALGMRGPDDVAALPFLGTDGTAGSEHELQAFVEGKRGSVDLPRSIEQSDFFANIRRRAAVGDLQTKVVDALERYLAENRDSVWDNSWVRFPRRLLGPLAAAELRGDLRADKRDPHSRPRADATSFLQTERGVEYVRVPISYLLKLSLADAIGALPESWAETRRTGQRLLGHFLSDNTSPETCSFNVVSTSRDRGGGRAVAREAARRFLFTQLLLAYANRRYELEATGQKAGACHAPTPPTRQRELNEIISDSFYRHLFMNPCLSGWDQGEEKRAYMGLCHEVLSRSQLNGVKKLHDAGIIQNNLVVLPNTSNISLANNGVHVSLGSKKLTQLLAEQSDLHGAVDEKHHGDLAIKIMEHFLPLFVGTTSAAPYRLGFEAFHPEKALGFLPHELENTHLRMQWRRWRGKAANHFLGMTVTPFGPAWVDKPLSRIFGLRGDHVPDYRLIDYLVFLLSTHRSPALSGELGNSDRLKQDLGALGVFDPRMSLYLLFKLREQSVMGFSGFEGRQYSLFERFGDDMAAAVDLQRLLSALAYYLVAKGTISHQHIPDGPTVESERRQVIFDCAIGLPTFFVHNETPNQFLRLVLSHTQNIRASRRYPGYLRVYTDEYRRGLLRLIVDLAPDLVEAMGLAGTVADLMDRLDDPTRRASHRLTKGILDEVGAKDPLAVEARTFNLAAERYYRGSLRRAQMEEAMDLLTEELEMCRRAGTFPGREAAAELGDAESYLQAVRADVIQDKLNSEEITRLLFLLLRITCAIEES